MFKDIFNRKKTVIGALHLPPLHGYSEFPGLAKIQECVTKDLQAFIEGGIDSIIFENNYDVPHTEKISEENKQLMLRMGKYIRGQFDGPIGVSVLWNDYKAALDISNELNLQFIRVPVFVDSVSTNYGTFAANPDKITAYRNEHAKNVALFTDIHVKHAKTISDNSIKESAKIAIKKGSDGVIITGRWTGDSPDIYQLQEVEEVVEGFPIIIGSGVDTDNINDLFSIANAAIVSTSLKEGGQVKGEVNVKGWNQRISAERVSKLMDKLSLF